MSSTTDLLNKAIALHSAIRSLKRKRDEIINELTELYFDPKNINNDLCDLSKFTKNTSKIIQEQVEYEFNKKILALKTENFDLLKATEKHFGKS